MLKPSRERPKASQSAELPSAPADHGAVDQQLLQVRIAGDRRQQIHPNTVLLPPGEALEHAVPGSPLLGQQSPLGTDEGKADRAESLGCWWERLVLAADGKTPQVAAGPRISVTDGEVRGCSILPKLDISCLMSDEVREGLIEVCCK